MTPAAILFDLDGTLVDSLADLTDAVNHARASFAMPPLTTTEVRHLVGKGSRNLIQRALETESPEDIERGLRLFLEFNAAHIADKSRLYPGVLTTLETLSATGVPLAVVSNKNEELSRLVLRALGAEHFFGAVCGGDTFSERKPSPLPLLRVLDDLGSSPAGSIMVGDSINDIQAAKCAGVTAIGCTWGYGGMDELEQADHLAHDPKEVQDLLLSHLSHRIH